jgi:hypothetical protein
VERGDDAELHSCNSQKGGGLAAVLLHQPQSLCDVGGDTVAVTAPFAMPLEQVCNRTLWPMGRCVRHDVIVRYLGVQHFVEHGTLHPLYEKLSVLRRRLLSKPGAVPFDPDRFPSMIRTFSDRGYLPDHPIVLDRHWHLWEGAHRLACSLWFQCDPIWAQITIDSASEEKLGWFEAHFTEAECATITRTLEELKARWLWGPLKKRLDDQEYPPNHQYNPATIEPLGLLANRIGCLESYAPELMQGGWSLLDIGANKGFISLALASRFRHVTGYEPIAECVDISEQMRRAHGITFCARRP